MPPGISTTSRRAPCPFCKGQRSGSKPCRVPSAPQPHICFSLFFLIPAFHCLSIAPASSPPTPWHCPSQGSFHPHAPFALLEHHLPLSHCTWHLQGTLCPLPLPTIPTSLLLHTSSASISTGKGRCRRPPYRKFFRRLLWQILAISAGKGKSSVC